MKILFAGTPDFALPSLSALIAHHHSIVAVYTQPDRPAGRGRQLHPSPVKQCAMQHALPVFQPIKLKGEAEQQQIRQLQPDVIVVVAYGLLLPQAVLDIPRFGCINVHASLLPRWRGAAPIVRAINAGDKQTGVCIMQMEAGLDTGPVLDRVEYTIQDKDTGGSVHDHLAVLGADALVATIAKLENGPVPAIPQTEDGVCYAAKITKEEARCHWNLSAVELAQQIRGFSPTPVAYTLLEGQVIRIHEAKVVAQIPGKISALGTIVQASKQGILVQTGDQLLCLTQIQLPGGKILPVSDVLRGHAARFAQGKQFE